MTTTYFETASPVTMKLLLAATLWRCSLCHRPKDPRTIVLGTRLLERKRGPNSLTTSRPVTVQEARANRAYGGKVLWWPSLAGQGGFNTKSAASGNHGGQFRSTAARREAANEGGTDDH